MPGTTEVITSSCDCVTVKILHLLLHMRKKSSRSVEIQFERDTFVRRYGFCVRKNTFFISMEEMHIE